jgi:predicted nucleic acid-binding Zn ribbon protein
MDNTQPCSIKEILKKTKFNIQNQQLQQNAQKAWAAIVGQDAAAHTQLNSLSETSLIVSVDSPAWVYQLNTKRRHIEEQLQKRLCRAKPIKLKLIAGDTTHKTNTGKAGGKE